jgi:hypothetical protein
MKQLSCELLVGGGGVAGSCAAIAAARCGVQTLLVERQGYLGGIGYAGMLPYICGLYLNGATLPEEPLNNGLTAEIVGLLMLKAPEKTVQKIGQVYVLPYAAADLQDVLATLLQAEPAVTVLRNTRVTGVEVERGAIRSVTMHGPNGTQTSAATMVVDCTGNGDVAVMAGAEFELSPETERQLAGFSVRVICLDKDDDTLSIKVPYYCALAVERSILPSAMKFTTFTNGYSPGEGWIKMSLDGEDTLLRDERALANAHDMLAYLGQVLPAFRSARIAETALKVLDREGRRIVGEYMLSREDILSARKFPDARVRNAWPVELWDRTRGTLYTYVPRGDFYEIPFRCLTVKGLTNLLTAGRCISVSHAALGSTRVMGICMALGDQAGRAAAQYVRNGNYCESSAGSP